MSRIDRLPAVPLIASDPYLSIWMPADTMTQTESIHWCGPIKPIHGIMTVDGIPCRFLGVTPDPEAALKELVVEPTCTRFVNEFSGVQLETTFTTPALPQDPDLMSMPVTLVSFRVTALDGAPHQVQLKLHLSDRLCWNGEIRPDMIQGSFILEGQDTAWCGRATQQPLNHTGDHITIDWGVSVPHL